MKGKYDVVIIGSGCAGLMAARQLGKSNISCLVIERNKSPGGMLESYNINGVYIEKFYHHIFRRDKVILRLINELGLSNKLLWKEVETSFLYNNKFYRLLHPQDIIKFRPLRLIDKFFFIRLMLKIKMSKNKKHVYDKMTVKDFVLRYGNRKVYENMFKILLKSKFGDDSDRISAAWLIERIGIRSNAGKKGEILGYLRGGFYQIIEVMTKNLENIDIVYEKSPDKIMTKNNKVFGVKIGKKIIKCGYVISTIPPASFMKLAELPESYKERLSKIKYQGSVCIVVSLKKSLTNKKYWTNIMETSPFGAVIEHTNFMPKEDYHNENIIYMGSYPKFDLDIWKKDDEEKFKIYFDKLKELFPHVKDEDIKWKIVGKTFGAGIIYETGILSVMPEAETPVENLYIGGMFSSYPERSINESLTIGNNIANMIIKKQKQNNRFT